jgi:glucose-fructose oxidoreductase
MIMSNRKVRYAVVGLGWIAQDSVLPAFLNSKENSVVTAIVSDDPVKLKEIGDRYQISHRYSYKEYDLCLNSGEIDAVYIALPNSMHCAYTLRAAEAGIHILCEKPMAMNEWECVKMIEAAQNNNVKLMIAYRLHFEEGNLKAVDIVQSQKLGDIRIFNSTFTMDVREDNSRLDVDLAGGSMYDLGIYCINAARSVFRSEPLEVFAYSAKEKDPRFYEVDEMTGAIIRFPEDRLAAFSCSFGAATTSAYEIIGTKGSLRVDPAFHHQSEVKHVLKIGKQKEESTFPARDQFAAEIVYFSDCVLENKNPEPSGIEGWADVRVIQAIYQAAAKRKPIALLDFDKDKRPSLIQSIRKPKRFKSRLVHASPPKRN